MSNNIAFQTLSNDQLDNVGGGFGLPSFLKPVAKIAGFAGKKVLGPISAAYSGYEGMNAFLKDRSQHKGIGTSLWDGVKAAVI